MADPYRGRSRHNEPSSTSYDSSRSRHAPYQTVQPTPTAHYSSATQYPYLAPGQSAPTTTHGYYSTSPPSQLEVSASTHGSRHRTSSGGVPRHSTYPPASTSERASKRQKSGTAPAHSAHMQVQWTSAPAQEDHMYPASHSYSSPGSRNGRDSSSSVSSGYNSPGYSQPHDLYGQQMLQTPSIPNIGPSPMRDAQFYRARHSQHASSEYEEEEEEQLDHGPTELPPRTYSGKSKYDPPRKPGKIPGSAMDYLPILEARFDRLENAIDRYVDYRGQRALSNSILPGMNAPEETSSSSHYSRRSSRHRDSS